MYCRPWGSGFSLIIFVKERSHLQQLFWMFESRLVYFDLPSYIVETLTNETT